MSEETIFTITVKHPDRRQITYKAYSFNTLGPSPDRSSYSYVFRCHAKNVAGGLPPQGASGPTTMKNKG